MRSAWKYQRQCAPTTARPMDTHRDPQLAIPLVPEPIADAQDRSLNCASRLQRKPRRPPWLVVEPE
jgi:hypothetical protein